MQRTRFFTGTRLHRNPAFWCLLVASLATLAGCVISARELVGSGTVRPARFDRVIPFQNIRDTIGIEMTANGEKGRYLLDTGANISVIDRMPLSGMTLNVGGAGSDEESMVADQLSALRIGGVEFADTYVASGNLKDLARSIPGFRGLIGQPVLSKADWLLDFQTKQLRFADALTPDDGMVEIPVTYRYGLPYVMVHIDGMSVEALLDTGASTQLAIPESSPMAEFLRERYHFSSNKRQIFSIGGTRTITQMTGTTPQLRVGNQVFADVAVDLRDTRRPRLGARFLTARGRVLIQGNGNLWLRP